MKYWSAADPEAALYEQIHTSAFTDGLTELKNKRHLNEQLSREALRARRHKRPLALLMIDIDFFKKVNDDHGHPAGDRVLQSVATQIRACARKTLSHDMVARRLW